MLKSAKSFLFSFLILFGFSKPCLASEDSYVLDGKEYTKEQIIEDFINAAFSELPWNADMTPEDRDKMYQKFFGGSEPDAYQTLKRQAVTIDLIPWLKPHIGENLKLPLNKRNVISRWERKSVEVAIDWPRFTKTQQSWYERSGFPENPLSMFSGEGTAPLYPKFTEAIKGELQALSAATGMDIGLMDPSDKADLTQDYGRIRFILQISSGVSVADPSPGYMFGPAIFEGTFFNGVLFESVTRSFLYGYLLPDTSLSLDLAICKVVSSLPDEMFKALVHECLVRALGLPSMSKNSQSLLSYWHSAHEERLTLTQYGFNVLGQAVESGRYQELYDLYILNGKPEAIEQIKKSIVWITIPDEFITHVTDGIPQYDLAMLSLLYCPELKSGMTPEQARAVLEKSEACFHFLERIAAKPYPVKDE